MRLVPEPRWDSDFALRLKVTPLTENAWWLDSIEQQEEPNLHLPMDHGIPGAPETNFRRVKITLEDLKKAWNH